ncbi:MAG: response regulator transcription factor [Acidobacteriia bacterium]|nr:response regulator transcription factor [Terriglobia bacterium]
MMILIADDDRIHVHMLTSRLKAKGFKVSAAFDAIQAWIAAIRTSPDAIILDIQMPGGTGMAVLKQLKSSTKTNQIPVVVLSGSIDPCDAERVKRLGADEYLPKPVDLAQLYSTLSKLLGVPLDSES